MDWYLKVLRNYIGFGGRARRKEYWMFVLVNFVLIMVLGIVDKILGWERAGGEGVLTTIYGLLVLLPSWAVLFRRLHDTDRSAWWLLLLLIPLVGWIVILIFNCQSGTPGENRFGRIEARRINNGPVAHSDPGLYPYLLWWAKSFGISRRHQDLASPMLSRRHAIMISTSLVYSGLTTRSRPSAISFSTNGYGIVATPRPASSACRLSSSEVTVRRGCLSSSCTVSTGRSRAVSATATPRYFTRVTSESGSGSW